MRRNIIVLTLTFLLVLGGLVSAGAADYPDKTITFVAWASAGGGSDRFNQAVKHSVDENNLTDVPVVTICKPGGGGAMGMSYVMSQPADGYNVLKVTTNLVLTPLTKNIPYDYENFIPIARMAIEPEVLYAKSGTGLDTIQEFTKYAASNNVIAGMYGTGTQNHIALLALADEMGIDVKYVPFKGGGEAIASLLGGHVDIAVSEPSEVAGQVEAGKLKPVLVFSKERIQSYPDTPTFKEVFDSNVEVMQFRGYVVKEGTPPEVVEYLRDLFEDAYNGDELQEYMAQNNMEPAFLRGDEFFSFVKDQVIMYDKFLKNIGLID